MQVNEPPRTSARGGWPPSWRRCSRRSPSRAGAAGRGGAIDAAEVRRRLAPLVKTRTSALHPLRLRRTPAAARPRPRRSPRPAASGATRCRRCRATPQPVAGLRCRPARRRARGPLRGAPRHHGRGPCPSLEVEVLRADGEGEIEKLGRRAAAGGAGRALSRERRCRARDPGAGRRARVGGGDLSALGPLVTAACSRRRRAHRPRAQLDAEGIALAWKRGEARPRRARPRPRLRPHRRRRRRRVAPGPSPGRPPAVPTPPPCPRPGLGLSARPRRRRVGPPLTPAPTGRRAHGHRGRAGHALVLRRARRWPRRAARGERASNEVCVDVKDVVRARAARGRGGARRATAAWRSRGARPRRPTSPPTASIARRGGDVPRGGGAARGRDAPRATRRRSVGATYVYTVTAVTRPATRARPPRPRRERALEVLPRRGPRRAAPGRARTAAGCACSPAATLLGGPRRGRLPRLEEALLLAPVAPSKIVAIGLNYRDHAAERGKPLPAEPLIFLKPPSAVIGPGAAIRRPALGGPRRPRGGAGDRHRPHGHGPRLARRPRPRHILGAVCVNDVTARELQDKDVQFTRAKGFDTFCPVGPCLATGLDLGRLQVTGRVNGERPPAEHHRPAHLRRPPPGLVRLPRDDAPARRYHLHGHAGRDRAPRRRRRGRGRGGGRRRPAQSRRLRGEGRHEDLSGHGQPEGDPRGRALGRRGRRHHQPEPAGQGERRPRGDPARDLPDRGRPHLGRGGGHRRRGHGARGPALGGRCTRTSWSSAPARSTASRPPRR